MKVVLQDGIKDCGICCLLSIIKHYGGSVSKEFLRDITDTTKSGVSAYKLMDAAVKLGFNVEALSGEIEKINVNNLPCIAHVIIRKSYKHFIVIYDIDFQSNKMLIMDPARGKKTISINEFKLITSNNYLFLRPRKKIPVFSENKVIKDSIGLFIKKNKIYLIFLFVLIITYFILNILSAFHFKYLIDFVINYNISNNLFLISLIVLIIYILKEFTNFFKNIVLLKYTEILDFNITLKTYEQIILLPYLYYKNRTTGEVVSRIKDLSLIKNFLAQLLTTLTTDVLSVLVFIIFLLKIDLKLTLISILLFITLIITNIIFKANIKVKSRKYYKKLEKLNSFLIESLESVDVIKGMHIEKLTIDRFVIKYKKLLESIYSLSLFNQIFILIKNNINNVFQVLILFFGTLEVIENKISFSQLIIYQSILSFFNNSLNNLINLINEYPNYKLAIERVEDLFTIKKEVFECSNYYSNYKLDGEIKYSNLNYSYNSKLLLKNINLKIKKGQKIFLYGPSGSGKTTLVKMLMRYIEIPFGNISINNIDINHYHLNVLRNDIVYVSQQDFLFTDTIYNNITLHKDISKDKVDNVVKITMTDEIVKNDQLYLSKIVEENGFNFSGGERQRIILARSILKDSNIYIFDEALSQIDIKREKKILKNIFRYLKDKTVIVISHRFDNKNLFTRVLNIKDGILYEEKL